MALHPDFPKSPHAILDPSLRWFPANEALRTTSMEKLMPPLVAALRRKVKDFRDSSYAGASATSKSLLTWWFKEPHLLPQRDGTLQEFQYFFAQREALETIIYIHDASLAWFKSIEDIHNRLLQKGGSLSLQMDVTATPKHNNDAIFVQTIADYPLVEAIAQNVVKHPVLPDAPSRAKLVERQSAKYTEKYADYIDLGVIEWRKAYAEHQKLGKKAVLFVMTDDL